MMVESVNPIYVAAPFSFGGAGPNVNSGSANIGDLSGTLVSGQNIVWLAIGH